MSCVTDGSTLGSDTGLDIGDGVAGGEMVGVGMVGPESIDCDGTGWFTGVLMGGNTLGSVASSTVGWGVTGMVGAR